ncbi:MAG: ATP-binding protein [Lachnospiraceae bacterium]|nr:ATP-binding protein [Lachnospiraceae bacterium]
MKKTFKEKLTFERHLYLIQLSSIILTVLTCAVISLFVNISSQFQIIGDNLLSTANTLSVAPSIIDSIERGSVTSSCRLFLEDFLNDMPVVDNVELIDKDGICLYHSDVNFIGKKVSDHKIAISKENTDKLTTKKGLDNRRYRIACSSVTGNNGETIGYITVCILYRRQFDTIWKSVPAYIIATCLMIAMGCVFAATLVNLVRRHLKGYDPEQFSQIYDGNVNVLNNIDEGVIAINTEGRITIVNNIGRDILGLPVIPYDRVPILDVLPESCLLEVLKTEQAIYNEHTILHGKNLLITHLPLFSNGQLVGAASLFHNAQIINEMAEKLENANNMVDTLRAFNHDFMNKLHVILGYLETDHIEEAKNYLLQSSMGSSRSISQISRIISHQGIAAIVIGKVIRATELNISLKLVPESYCRELTTGIAPNIYVTIMGNLLQNAMEELNSCEQALKEIQLTIFIDAESTYISVLDTGRGMPRELIEKVIEHGFSTKGTGRGTGLYLVNRIVDDLDGSLKIESEPGEGTVVTVMFRRQVRPE